MRVLDLFARTRFAEALSWTLLHSLWEGVIIAASLAALLALLRSSRARYICACLALLAMLGSFVVTLIHFWPESGGSRTRILNTLPLWRELPGAAGGNGRFLDLAALIPWLAPGWFAGVCLFYLYSAAGWLSLYKLRRRGVCSAPDTWQRRFTRLASELKVARPVALVESLFAETPVVLGHFRPMVLTPLGFLAGLPGDQVEVILLHELAHIRRADYLINACQRLIEGLLFYHPAAWWVSRIIRSERENCCDDMVVALRGDAHGYAKALTALEQNRQEPLIAATGGNLVKRVKRLLYPKVTSGIGAAAFAAIVLTASTAVALAAWHVSPGQNTADGRSSDPWQKWLNEDVVYIIADAERAAFERLQTDEERQHFVEQFWARRDPTPATPDNEFKDEHYRRVSFVNQHFGTTASGIAGWRTDRGHMYILYGPPDEIESHPKKADGGYATEMWRYRHVEGLSHDGFFTFLDPTGAGDYRLAPGTSK